MGGGHEIILHDVVHIPSLPQMVLSVRKFTQVPDHGFSGHIQGRTLNFPTFRLRVDRDFNIVGYFASSVRVDDCILVSSYSTENDDSCFESDMDSLGSDD